MLSCRQSLKFLITFVNIVIGIVAVSRFMAAFNSGKVRGLHWYTLNFRYPPKKKLQD